MADAADGTENLQVTVHVEALKENSTSVMKKKSPFLDFACLGKKYEEGCMR